ncbi:hypothetical protein AN396_02775 [Candidatus Epulonipiscium fishelsonii]|uniref:Uncharacterized protein n=1 Tax=Candidatus Epulonipiscium fishelsonii TaxID=77094 RepID=A0ACC8XF45_9FIRM|nr:hypothetical protein AN396_02775 [Epulopiscium sp. SCG-B11WGA-EpuloA1]
MREIDKILIDKLRTFSTCELCDGLGIYSENAVMDYDIKPMVTTKKIVGPAFTIKVPFGEGSLVADAIEQVKEGEVLVIAGNGNLKSSYWGDHRGICAKMQKAEGVVIDGAFRDIDDCKEVGFPVYAKGVIPKTAGKTGAGELQVSVSCGGIVVNPGDIVVGDRNGVIVIPIEKVEDAILKAQAKITAQQNTIRIMEQTNKVITKIKVF